VPLLLMQNMALGLTLTAIVEEDSDPHSFIPTPHGRFPFDTFVSTRPFIEINEAITATRVNVVLTFD
jgi:aryl-alcohol dehydrogenase